MRSKRDGAGRWLAVVRKPSVTQVIFLYQSPSWIWMRVFCKVLIEDKLAWWWIMHYFSSAIRGMKPEVRRLTHSHVVCQREEEAESWVAFELPLVAHDVVSFSSLGVGNMPRKPCKCEIQHASSLLQNRATPCLLTTQTLECDSFLS